MAKFGDLDQYFDPGLTLTVGGTEYVVPPPSAELGLWCQQVARLAGAIKSATTEVEMLAIIERVKALEAKDPDSDDSSFAQRMLRELWHELAGAGVDHHRLEFCGQTVYIWIMGGEEKAAAYWRAGGDPEAVSPTNRAERRAVAKKAKKTVTAGVGATKPPGSTSGTSSPRKSSASAKAPRSRGTRS